MADRRFRVKKKASEKRPHITLLILLVLLIAGSIWMFWPPTSSIHQGLDVQGGLSVVLQADKTDGTTVTAADMQSAQSIVEQRVNLLGASEASVQIQGTSQLLVQIPGAIDQTNALNVIGQAGVLEFVDLSTISDDTVKTAVTNGSYVDRSTLSALGLLGTIPNLPVNAKLFVQASSTDGSGDSSTPQFTWPTMMFYNPLNYSRLPLYDLTMSGQWQPLQLSSGSYQHIFTGSDITQVTVDRASEGSAYYAVNLVLNATATQAFADVTTQLYPTKGQIMIVLDGFVQSAPAVQSAITNGRVAITGGSTGFSINDANTLRTILQSGSLPVSLSISTAQVVGPTLGQDALRAGILVALIGLGVVAIYLLIFYKGLGVLTAAAMSVFALLYLGVLALLSFFGLFALSLSGIAGIVLAIGVAADSSILVLERFKEEIRMGRSVRAASMSGVRHAIQTSIDADLVTAVSALALFFIGVGSVRGFGLTLVLGVICDILTMLIFKAPIIRLLAPKIITRHPAFWGIQEDVDVALAAGELKRSAIHG
ncbi:MAG: protein translocase subunit SecD [Actinomycetia bacterium]|nr:protein translocase subunit SecD [Actinomycetes bacterium]